MQEAARIKREKCPGVAAFIARPSDKKFFYACCPVCGQSLEIKASAIPNHQRRNAGIA